MPLYIYYCSVCNSEVEVTHGMFEKPVLFCSECGKKLRKRFQPVSINWAGDKPSNGGRPKVIQDFLEDTPARKDRTEAKYNAR
jgi:putative FmdB family regulatory protein